MERGIGYIRRLHRFVFAGRYAFRVLDCIQSSRFQRLVGLSFFSPSRRHSCRSLVFLPLLFFPFSFSLPLWGRFDRSFYVFSFVLFFFSFLFSTLLGVSLGRFTCSLFFHFFLTLSRVSLGPFCSIPSRFFFFLFRFFFLFFPRRTRRFCTTTTPPRYRVSTPSSQSTAR